MTAMCYLTWANNCDSANVDHAGKVTSIMVFGSTAVILYAHKVYRLIVFNGTISINRLYHAIGV